MNSKEDLNKAKSITLANQKTIFYNLLKYSRKTIELSISSSKVVTIKAPSFMPNFMIESFIKKKSEWIIKKLNKKTQIRRVKKQSKFKNQELHNLLGKSYPLVIAKSTYDQVNLTNDQLVINTKNISQIYVKELLYVWYRKKAEQIFPEIYDECWKEFSENKNYNPPKLKIKKVKSIWGSLSISNNMTINLELIRFPKVCIKYIFFHELCHLKHRNHGLGFKSLLTQNMPNWKEIRNKLRDT